VTAASVISRPSNRRHFPALMRLVELDAELERATAKGGRGPELERGEPPKRKKSLLFRGLLP